MKAAVFVIAAIYLAADEVFSSVAKPIGNWLARVRMLEGLRNWISALRPYPALALFLVPIVVLEPLKPVAAYLAATGYLVESTLTFVIGEILKLVFIDRLFQLTRDKLMTIPAFAWCYLHLRAVLDWFESLPAWKMLRAMISGMKASLRKFVDQTFADRPAQPPKADKQARS